MKYISVIVPLYNKGPHIKKTIKSIINQTYRYFEIIVVNDGSTDNGPKIVENINDSRVRLIHQENKGVSSARNTGIRNAKYDLIALLDADDKWEDNFLENMIKMHKKYPEAGLIGSGYKIKRKGKIKIAKFRDTPENEGIIKNYFKAVIYRNPTCSSSVLMRKDVILSIGGFPEDMKRGEDSITWCKIALNYSIAFINKPLMIRNMDAVNRVSSKNEILDNFPLFEYINENNIKLSGETKYFLKEYIYKKNLSRAKQCLKIGNKRMAREFLYKSKETKIFRGSYWKMRFAMLIPSLLLSQM